MEKDLTGSNIEIMQPPVSELENVKVNQAGSDLEN